MDSGSQDRNLPASERKLKKARDDGQVSRSQDLTHLALLGVGCFVLLTLSPIMYEHLQRTMQQQLRFDATAIRYPLVVFERLQNATAVGLAASAVFGVLVSAAVVVASIAAGGWVLSLKPLLPDFSRVNPLSGFGNLFSKKQMLTVSKTVVMMLILLSIAAVFLKSGLVPLSMLLLQPSPDSIGYLVQWMTGGLGLMLLVVLGAAMIDVPLQSFLHKDQMKMSHQEVKQESKESDGNPQLKGKIRQRQRELAQKASVNAVPKADFVVMNPTHFAVAIRYDEKTMAAPQVISKGADLLALRIRDLAKQNAVPVLQSPMLARALYANAELNEDIPATLYTAVAQVLAYVYRLRAALKGMGPMPQEVPQPFVPPELDPLSNTVKAATA
ncbi:EscU/YscU/HrcU family type III secretion system export apparatus switch protein [Curvibacter sp. APW13]|uniref:EscU/YscU/HrcU family type III secretion system export apparatus switch protein n=1 Tax=Curvibacter sp. APW13 TaxID=3077236 RepID=UPI0028DD5690|nr:EscU/YscU/HrcU family type III secretion system export apparatus switch protein [Curvibacter sp. APW13]MDT8993031.1 EscU/YscU/HrcU family type III secretion system export apparatus switch protein [Curvibacter sp. APW13]